MDFHLPELGEGIYEAELVEWRVQPGDTIKRGQELAEVVTDKASMPLPAPFFGRIGELRAVPGDMLKVGEVILTFEPSPRGSDGKDAEATPAQGKQASTSENARATQSGDGSAARPAAAAAPAAPGPAARKPGGRGQPTAVAQRPRTGAATSRVSAAPTVRR